ncbi:Endosomal/prevacuolar sodium/hydrogen exchanger [Neolecta irregularis DAH-3]|uniref:Endosomal/prevacuolar sodium/hydrogen exchanger n=1 Tax=Neolecta irregularis (strain DAH-3) TaxID=1198029 RepID=A0A1U7LW77_NEOID|nr:Endosomal/prevacuolar sodium/hydrogen exchanger [Neolecta irregularis DAH-3]|eukprot:OLL26936.1 Endosomal/prevacuolar sodium/hydrogen exchanger [Neolecta irregularis DAH-3]
MPFKRTEIDIEDPSDPVTEELYSSWALFILVALLIVALFSSYYLQRRKIRAVHESVVSIFAGMVVGLIIRVSPGLRIQEKVSFHYSYFFNLLLPPIILNSGFELRQALFFRNIGTILTFALLGTFISAIVIGAIVYAWSLTGLEAVRMSFLDAMSVGATLSATDPVTVLSIFTQCKAGGFFFSEQGGGGLTGGRWTRSCTRSSLASRC